MIKLIIIWILTVLITANTVSVSINSNFNLGVMLMWGLSFAFIMYAIFYKKIDKFCENGIGRGIKIVFFIGLAVFCALVAFLVYNGRSNTAKEKEKAIIVLGAGVNGETVGDALRRRLESALEVYEQDPDILIVVTGGQGPQEAIPEALAMKRWLLARGVLNNSIIVEDKSTSTEENLRFAAQLLKEEGVGENAAIAVVTNNFHCYRAGQYAKKVGFTKVRTVPASISPTIFIAVYMREVLALLFMWVFK